MLDAMSQILSLKQLVSSLEREKPKNNEAPTQSKRYIFTAFRSNATRNLEQMKIYAPLLDGSDCTILESFQERNANVPILMCGLLVDFDGSEQRGDSALFPGLVRAMSLTRSGSILAALANCRDQIGPLQISSKRSHASDSSRMEVTYCPLDEIGPHQR
jgi:hypothetical protein